MLTLLAIQAGRFLGVPLHLAIRVSTHDFSLRFEFLTLKRWVLIGSAHAGSADSELSKPYSRKLSAGLTI